MSFSTVLVYEFFCGGGCPAGELSEGVTNEALGMLWAILKDFRSWGGVRTITALDPRFEGKVGGMIRRLPADEVVYAEADKHEEVFLSLLKCCNAVLVLAPETGGILSGLTAHAERAGIPVLGSCASAAATAGDKAACNRIFQKARLPTPRTRVVSFLTAANVAESMGYPLVVKPIDGVGSEGISRVNGISDLSIALAMIRRLTSNERILLQSFTCGIHASVSLLIARDRCLPLSLNRQMIKEGLPFHYHGSQVPFVHQSEGRALELACTAAGLIPGLSGYVGVDLVLASDVVQLIEINPRLTTSYIGLCQVSRINIARAIWDACRDDVLPDHVPLAGQVVIKKNEPESWG
jgi:predicted ATP-grasp superfamily ATP-dependent carboligase